MQYTGLYLFVPCSTAHETEKKSTETDTADKKQANNGFVLCPKLKYKSHCLRAVSEQDNIGD